MNLGLDLPRSFTRSFWSGARYVRLSLSAKNPLWYVPHYWGVDPEVNNNGSQNIRIGFDDIGPYPPSRSFWASIDLGF